MSRWFLGCDPGVKGALAFLSADGRLAVADMPRAPGLAGRDWVDTDGLAALLRDSLPIDEVIEHAVLEDVHSMPSDGHVGAFSFGRSRGVVEGAFAALGICMTLVRPAVWKAAMRVTADKRTSLARATQLFPACAAWFTRQKDDGRAEAALLALYCALSHRSSPTTKVIPHDLRDSLAA